MWPYLKVFLLYGTIFMVVGLVLDAIRAMQITTGGLM